MASLFRPQGPIQDKEVQIFYSNMCGENNRDNCFYFTMYRFPIAMNPNYMAKLLRILQEADGIEFSIMKLTLGKKGDLIDLLCTQFVS